MNKNKKKGFTLVELLAVIVILAIILIIAVPKIMETIKNAKIGSMESSAKLIAKSVETNYQVSLSSGEGGTLSLTGSCLDSKFVDIDLNEYESCTYTITDGKAKVTLKGKDSGKFAGLTCTDATNTTATCSSSNESYITITATSFSDDTDINQMCSEPEYSTLDGCDEIKFKISSEYANLTLVELIDNHFDGADDDCKYIEFININTGNKLRLLKIDSSDLIVISQKKDNDNFDIILIYTNFTLKSEINGITEELEAANVLKTKKIKELSSIKYVAAS